MLLATSFIAANVCGQSLTTITEYYDYFRTRVKRVYTVLPNNKKHGTEKGYLQSGVHICTNTYHNGERTAVKVFFTDGSVKVDAKIAPKGSADASFCTDYSLYAISNNGQRALGMKSKLHNAQPFDNMEKLSYTLARDRWYFELGDYRVESYQQNYLDGKPRIRFSTSADKKTEHFITYDQNGEVNDDVVYDIASETLTINVLSDRDYSVKDETLTFHSEDDIIIKHGDLEYKIPDGTQIKIDNKIAMNRKDYYKKLTDVIKDEDTDEFVVIVRENGLNFLLGDDFMAENIDIKQLEFLGRRLKWNSGAIMLNVLLKPKESGKLDDGIYSGSGKGTYLGYDSFYDIEAVYTNNELSYINIQWQNGANYIKGAVKNGGFNGLGESYIDKNNYIGQFVNSKVEGNGKLITPEYTYEGEFKNNYITGKGKKIYTCSISNAEVSEVGSFLDSRLVWGTRVMKKTHFTIEYKIEDEDERGGRITWSNGDYYVGDDLMYFDGEGKMHYTNGDYFDGYITKIFDYVSNSRSREKYTKYSSGGYDYKKPEIGRFEQGKIRVTLESGIIYEGDYDKGFKGNGKLILVNGDELSGEFTENQLNYLQPINVKLNLPTGDVFEGVYVAGKFNGQGKLTTKGGEVYEGVWKSGKFLDNPKIKLPIKKITIPTISFDLNEY